MPHINPRVSWWQAESGGQVVYIANVMFHVNQAGLHAKRVPLSGLSYTL